MGYSWDDREALFQNPAVRDFDLRRILTQDYWAQFGGAGIYRPILSLSLAFDVSVFGDAPYWLHASSLLWHGVAVLLLAAGIQAFCPGAFWPAFALLYFHPTSAEQAAWLVGRTSALMLALGGAAMLAARARRFVLAAVLIFLAAHAREDGVLFVFVLALLLDREDRRRWLPIGVLVVLAWLAVRWAVLGGVLPRAAHWGTQSFAALTLTSLDVFGHFAAMLGLVEAPRVMSDGVPSAGPFVVALPLVLTLLVWAGVRRGQAARGLVWVLVAFLPFSQWVPHGEAIAGRYAYALLPGFTLFALLAMPARMRTRWFCWVIPLLLVPLWLRQAWIVSDGRRAFAQVAAAEPANARAALLRALAHENAGEKKLALARLRALVKDRPNYAKARVNYGRVLFETGRYQRAEDVLSRAVRLFPRSARAALTLGRLQYRRKKFGAAAFAFEEALERDPRLGQAARYLCRSWLRLGDREAARAALDVATRIDARHASLAKLRAAVGQ